MVNGKVLTAAQVELTAQEGRREILVEDGILVTPLARDRAAVLGVTLNGTASPAEPPRPSGPSRSPYAIRGRPGREMDAEALKMESRVRIVARRLLLRRGLDLSALEQLVAAVVARLQSEGG